MHPLIAAVLLIAITIAIAAVLAGWVGEWTRAYLAQLEERCYGAALTIDGADYNCTSGKLSVAVYNSGDRSLARMQADLVLLNNSIVMLVMAPNISLAPGADQVYYNFTEIAPGAISILRISSRICPTAADSIDGAEIKIDCA